MTRRIALLLSILAVFALALAPAGPAQAGGEIARHADFVKRVNEAIDRGATWLLAEQRKNGGFGEYSNYPAAQTAIAYHTLRVCGIPRDDAAMTQAYDALRREYVAARNHDQLRTYTAALVMMAIESRGWPEASKGTRKSRYGTPDSESASRLDGRDLEWMRELVEFMEGNQNSDGAWSYGQQAGRYTKRSRLHANVYDHSNTQYALLGLKAASRTGVQVDPEIYERALKHLLEGQENDGPTVPRVQFVGKKETFTKAEDRARGWAYRALDGATSDRRGRRRQGMGQGPYGSMTAGSLGALVICRSELLGWSGYSQKLDAEAEQAVWDGVAWLGQNFDVTTNPNMGGWHFYYLYGLERAGVLAGVDWMGEHDWYGDGAEFLLGRQDAVGSWSDAGPRAVTTCFALLFLKKGTKPVLRGAVTPSGGADSIDFGAAIGMAGKDLEDFVDLVVSRWHRASGSAQRDALQRGIASVGRSVVLPLFKRMATGNEDQRRAAHSIMVDISGQALLFDASADADTRFDQLIAWEEWYMARADRLHYDSETGRLQTR